MKKFWLSKITHHRKIFIYIFRYFIFWQLLLLLISFMAGGVLTPQLRFAYNDGPKIINPQFLWPRANFDGSHYLGIARGGYGLYQQAFFPLYPKMIRMLTQIFGGKDLLAAVFISNLSAIIAFFIFYLLVLFDYKEDIAKRAFTFYLIFPAAFFLGMVYTESLFLMLILGSFYAARKGKWWTAGILGALSAHTRIVGVFIFPALIWEWWEENKIKNLKLKIKSLLPVLITPLGLVSYMSFLNKNYHDPLLFLHVQPFFGAGRSGGKIILIYQVFWRYFKMIFSTKMDPLYFTVWLEFLTSAGFLLLILLSYKKGIRISYLIFAVFAYFIPTFSGTFLSMPRFALSFFPCFIYLGTIKKAIIYQSLMIVFGILFIFSSILFLSGYWVA